MTVPVGDQPRDAAYAAGIAGTLVATAASLSAGVAGLWLLNRVLSKEMFGGYAFAMNLTLLGTLIASLGLDRTLLLRVAGLSDANGLLRGWGLMMRVMVWGAGAAALLAVSTAAAGGFVPAPNGYWLIALAPALPFFTIIFLIRAWFQANHRTGLANLTPGLADICRAALVAVVWLTGGGPAGVAAAVLASAVVPLASLLGAMLGPWRGRLRRAPRRLSATDVGQGLPFLVQSLSAQGMVLLDVVVVGLAAPGAATGDYALAARLALFSDSARVALKSTFTARARRHLARGDHARLSREFHAVRLAGFLSALLAAAGLAALGRPILEVFGRFASAEPALLILAASHLVVGGAGMHTSVLSMGGEMYASAAIRTVALVGLVASIALLAPIAGAKGAALGLLLSQACATLGTGLLLRRCTGLAVMPTGALLRLLGGVGILLLTAGESLPTLLAAALLLGLALAAAWAERDALADVRALITGGPWRP